MLPAVKKYADEGNVRRLRYIFRDSLDVDPTFEAYYESYRYCDKVSNLFDEHKELHPMMDNQELWNMQYWQQLSIDLMNNYSRERFEHMIRVAPIVYAEKVKCLQKERQAKREQQRESNKISQPVEKNSFERKVEYTDSNSKLMSMEQKKVEQDKQELAEKNRKATENEKAQQARVAARKAELAKKTSNSSQRGDSTKKLIGLVILIIIVIGVALMFLK